jgi:hypothetical protein
MSAALAFLITAAITGVPAAQLAGLPDTPLSLMRNAAVDELLQVDLFLTLHPNCTQVENEMADLMESDPTVELDEACSQALAARKR